MKVAYVDMVGGAAGNMLLGAWIDAGVDRAALERALRTVVPTGWELVVERVVRGGIAATHADIAVPGEDDRMPSPYRNGDGRHLSEVLDVIAHSGLSERQIERAKGIYRRLGEAEARVHGSTVDHIHFHEVGQIDAILDVAATCIAVDLLGIEQLYCSSFPAGGGITNMHHGAYPNPAPATMELLRGAPLRAVDVEAELVTPTAAAILSTLVEVPGRRVDMSIERVGYGAGRRDLAIPNVVRVIAGVTADVRFDTAGDDVMVLEANIDDMSPQYYELALERIFAAGALDVWLTPIIMKKGRPAITLSAVAPPADTDAVAQAILRETSTIGVRVHHERRAVLAREVVSLDTSFGPVRLKRASAGDTTRLQPEYDDVVRIARDRGMPIAEVAREISASLGGAALCP